MKLFKDKIIKEKLKNFDIPDIDIKISKIKNWLNMYEDKSLHKKTETQCEQPFSQDIFIDILGYKSFPNEIYNIEPKAKTETSGQKPDAILGYFYDKENIRRVNAVVEYKDVNTSLDRPQQREGNLSPVQQAFKYKPQYSSCDFVVVSNFYEIRLYKDNQLDYEIFTLKDLCNPEEEYYQFRKFYYLLCSNNLIKKEGTTITYDLISKIRIEQEVITNNFYKEYKDIRYKLLQNIYQKNSIARSNSTFLIKKTQTIIDRVIFICFCEDRDLLPDNTLQILLKQSEEALSSFWDSLKGLFNLINHGHEKLGIPNGYNGGLFKEDLEINNLKIDDNILKDIVNFCKYDFSEDLSVNILGHIFEQSISDLEEIKLKIENNNSNENENILEQISKRKKDGIFYTPDYIVDYIVRNSLMKYLEDKEIELKEKYGLKEGIKPETYTKRQKEVYEEYQTFLHNIKIIDPACGSGAFLVKVFEYLLSENNRVGEIVGGGLFSTESYFKSILQNNIFGVDLNEESVEITKLSLWLNTAQKGKKLTTLDNNIKCGNSLIDMKEIAGEKAFKWEEEFKTIMENGGFDVVVGNPPYVDNRGFDKNDLNFLYIRYKNSFEKSGTNNYKTTKLNLISPFLEKSLSILKPYGYNGFIFHKNILKTNAYAGIRKFIANKYFISKIIDWGPKQFKDVVAETATFIIKKEDKINRNITIESFNLSELINTNYSDQYNYQNSYDFIFNIDQSDNDRLILEKIERNSDNLENFVNINNGIVTGNDSRFLSNNKLDESYKKTIRGKDISRYSYPQSKEYVIYNKKDLLRPRDESIFLNKEKLIMQMINSYFVITYDDNCFYNLGTTYAITKKNNIDVSLKSILAVLNSKLIRFYYTKKFTNNSSLTNAISTKNLFLTPINSLLKTYNKDIELIISTILIKNKELAELTNKFIDLLKIDFNIEKLNTKLENWYNYDFSVFKKELFKLKIILVRENEENWLDRFNRFKNNIIEIKEDINKTDIEIDKFIYKVYNLNEEEIKIIEKL